MLKQVMAIRPALAGRGRALADEIRLGHTLGWTVEELFPLPMVRAQNGLQDVGVQALGLGQRARQFAGLLCLVFAGAEPEAPWHEGIVEELGIGSDFPASPFYGCLKVGAEREQVRQDDNSFRSRIAATRRSHFGQHLVAPDRWVGQQRRPHNQCLGLAVALPGGTQTDACRFAVDGVPARAKKFANVWNVANHMASNGENVSVSIVRRLLM